MMHFLVSYRCCYRCRSPDRRSHKFVDVESDNCCRCNYSAMKRIAGIHNRDTIYVSYHNKVRYISQVIFLNKRGSFCCLAVNFGALISSNCSSARCERFRASSSQKLKQEPKENEGGRVGQKNYSPLPLLPFLLTSLKLSCSNSNGNACYAA